MSPLNAVPTVSAGLMSSQDALASSAAQTGPSFSPDASLSASGGEAVTVSAQARMTTQLLESARGASGSDAVRVQQLRGAMASGSYTVPAQDVARSMIAAMKETL